jgi:hypothetical protein
MATEQKPPQTDRGPWYGAAMDEDVPAPMPTLIQESHVSPPVGAWIAIGLGVVIMALLAVSVFLFRSNAPEHDRSDVLALSRRFVVALTTYDAATLPNQRERVLGMATGGFRSDYDRLASNPAFSSAVNTAKASSQGKIVTLAVSSLSGDNATVLGVVDVIVSNKDLTTPRVTRRVIQLMFVNTSSGWKVDTVTLLGTLTT